MDTNEIGKRIRARRNKLGLTQEELGARMGLSGAAIGHYETGERTVSAPDLARLAQILETPITYFYDEEDFSTVYLVPNSGDAIKVTGRGKELATADDIADIRGQLTELRDAIDKMLRK